ncbi:response regulator [Paenibacillus sp. GCM10023248]|uniref:response regulator transcription factor n=1 Tax=unclassified Paenibacillus TaxID=185978 RepID=UPI002378385C|nr:response regulator [Paenibacillus sp. MAHUQ-63]MDD9268965.1 response regulator [Paenibacillus sp. MAHUQ-63]
MTIKLLIVDDEPIICQGLRETIHWESIGVEVVGEAYDGYEALACIERTPVDVVLTDINMDGMDGLELAKGLKQRFPRTRVIIVSGYDDFEYARQALRLGIEDYLLKPVNIEELMGMVERIGVEIAQERLQHDEQELERSRKWLKSKLQDRDAARDDTYVPSIMAGGSAVCRMIATQIADYAAWVDSSSEEQRRESRALWESAVDDALRTCGLEPLSFFHHPNLLLTLCAAPLTDNSDKLHHVLNSIGLAPGVQLYAGVSQPFSAAEQIYPSAMEAMGLLQFAVLPAAAPVVFHNEEFAARKGHPQPDLLELEKSLIQALFQENYDDLDRRVHKALQDFRESGCLIKEVWHALQELVIMLQRRLRSTGIDLTGYPDLFHTHKMDLFVHNSYRAMESLLQTELEAMYSLVHNSLTGKNHWLTDRVKSYIEARYNKDIKASEVAAWLKITPNYFSILFKQKFGKGFAEYLNEVRIEQAKARLTETDDRVFEIAESVGYKEYKYFCAIFKTYTGITPTQYRKLAHTT